MHFSPRQPYLSYLRVFEPLSAFKEADKNTWNAQEKQGISREDVERDEDMDGLHRLVRLPVDPYPNLAAERALIVSYEGEKYYCPLQKRLNVALAVLELEDHLPPGLLNLFVPPKAREIHKLGDVLDVRLHTKISAWGVPLPWFVFIEPADQQNIIELADGEINLRIVVPIREALKRVTVIHDALQASEYTIDILVDLEELMDWFSLFDNKSVVEVDYGSLASRTYPDDSPQDISMGLQCLLEGDLPGTAAAYRRLALRWIPIRQLSRAS